MGLVVGNLSKRSRFLLMEFYAGIKGTFSLGTEIKYANAILYLYHHALRYRRAFLFMFC